MFTFVIIHQKHKGFIIEVLEDTPPHKILGQNRLTIWSVSHLLFEVLTLKIYKILFVLFRFKVKNSPKLDP